MGAELGKIEDGIPTAEKAIPRQKPFTSKPITVRFSVKKLLVPGLILIGLVIAGFMIWKFIPGKEAPLVPKIANSIAVISFENLTGDRVYDYLQKAIPNLLITNLEQAGVPYVATWERLRDLLKQMKKGDVEIINRDLGKSSTGIWASNCAAGTALKTWFWGASSKPEIFLSRTSMY